MLSNDLKSTSNRGNLSNRGNHKKMLISKPPSNKGPVPSTTEVIKALATTDKNLL